MLPFALIVFAAQESVIPGEGLRQDVEILERAYRNLHPGLYRYQSASEVDERFASLRRDLEKGATLRDAYLAFSGFAAAVRCGHTYANFFNQPKPVAEALFQGRNRLPFYFRWIGDRMIVTRSLGSDAGLTPGTEIVSLNGTPSDRILARLMPYARADGGNDAKRRANLSVQGYGRYEAFDIFYPLVFPVQEASVAATIRRPKDKRTEAVRIKLLTQDERLAVMTKPSENAGWEFRFLKPNVGYLRMPTWALFNSKWDWRHFLRGTFAELSAANADLIVDVRGNEGGLDVGNEILRYVVRTPLTLAAAQRFVRAKATPPDLVPYLDTWDRSFFNWGGSAGPEQANARANVALCRLTRFDDTALGQRIQPAERRLPGRLIVLVDAENSSATFQFAQTVQLNRLGTLVGEPTGGNRRGINGGALFFLRLPNSKIELDLPLIATIPSTDEPDGGLEPDVRASLSMQDLATGRDSVLETAVKKLAKP